MRINAKKRLAIVATTTAAVLLGGGVAVAFWTQAGDGTGTATTADPANLDLSVVTPPSGLYPGGPAQTLAIDVDNPNPSDITLNSVTITVAGSSPAGCNAGNFTIVNPSIPVGGVNVVAGGSVVVNGSIRMDNLASNQDVCQNKTINLDLASL